ncbi:hypothetical protein AOLI_G00139070 [Acnodon oligacanthus]
MLGCEESHHAQEEDLSRSQDLSEVLLSLCSKEIVWKGRSLKASRENCSAHRFVLLSPTPVFYPFGSGAGDTFSPPSDDGSSSAINLQRLFSFFGRTYTQLYVNNNGYLTFDKSSRSFIPIHFSVYSGSDIIAPLWTDIDNRANGVISYNQYSTGSVLSQATQDVNQYFPGVNFTASWVFVATWDRVAYFNYSGTAGYATNFTDRFTILWSNDSVHASVSNLNDMSNVNVSGRWAFGVNKGPRDSTTKVSPPPVFYPFGSEAGDIVNPGGDDGSSSAVNNNGYLTFDQSWKNYTPMHFSVYSRSDIIAPLWTDIDNRANGAGYATNFTDRFTILWSNDSVHGSVSNLNDMSNVNVSGRWAFGVNKGPRDSTTKGNDF